MSALIDKPDYKEQSPGRDTMVDHLQYGTTHTDAVESKESEHDKAKVRYG